MTRLKYIPVFAGRTENDEYVVLYKNLDDERELHVLRPDGELWALSPGSKVHSRFELDTQMFLVVVESPEWNGAFAGTRQDITEAEAR